MMRRTFILWTLLMVVAAMPAQTTWDLDHLQQVKSRLDLPAYQLSYRALMGRAETMLGEPDRSVMQKSRAAVSGDMHDYLSQARYSWPDPTRPDGLPYINRDGVSNPEIYQLDRYPLSEMTERVGTFALAWYFSGEQRFADAALRQLRTWFLDKATRMNPHLRYAQIVRGQNGDLGRSYGLIDSYSFVDMLSAVALLEVGGALPRKDGKALRRWFSTFLNWYLTSQQGQEEARVANNHSVAYDVQAIAYGLFTGETSAVQPIIDRFLSERLYRQVMPDGSQPHELRRTLAFGYSEYNLQHVIDLCFLTRQLPVDIARQSAPDGRSLCKAIDFLTPYLGQPLSAWPYQQISQWEQKQQELCDDLYRLYRLRPELTHYRELWRQHTRRSYADIRSLLYLSPEDAASQWAFIEGQLQTMIREARAAATDHFVEPRTLNADGTVKMVGAHDWCSGFFPGMLWMMYEHTGLDSWRREANLFTLPLEGLKTYRNSHDLGFMVNNSWGKGFRLTGEQAYRDVLIEASKCLISRFNAQVGCIRSWDHNKDRWRFPVIIDNMMNLEMLFEATQLTGDSSYYAIAVKHADTTLKNHFRSDGSSFHLVDYDPATGHVLRRQTVQGFADSSSWSRGQAWGLYGYTVCYRYTHEPRYLRQAERIAAFIFSQPHMPSDLIPYWDMRDPKITGPDVPIALVPRDASAAAITASALYELALYVPDQAQHYRQQADQILSSLTSHYQSALGQSGGFLLQHSTGHLPVGSEIDVPLIYADYYYMEALLRQEKNKPTISQ